MSGALFPSGPWTGFYAYSPQDRHRMDLHLEFHNGRVRGTGSDDLGRFLIHGHYDESRRECYWLKRYLGAHEVYYQGYREGKGIWGRWEIGALSSGGFHIWPVGAEEGETESVAEAAPVLEAVGHEEHCPAVPS